MTQAHRKRCRRYDVPGDAHFLTFSCYQRLPLLSRRRSCQWLLDALRNGRDRADFDLWAYVVMPEHVHLVVLPRPEHRIRDILKSLKQSVARRAFSWLERNNPAFLDRLKVVRTNGTWGYRFWQRGGGYDRNLRSVADIHEKIAYVHNNPVRRGLVQRTVDWQWSSALAWESGGSEPLPIDRDSVPRLNV